MLHWLLSEVHRALNRLGGKPASPGDEVLEEFGRLVEVAVDELRKQMSGDALEGGMREIDIRKIITWLQRYLQQHAVYDGQWSDWDAPPRPAHFEVSFGPRHRESDSEGSDLPDDGDPLSTLEPFELECDGELLRFAGRIDRIDLGSYAGQPVFTIVDYKSGSVSKRTNLQAVLEGRSFQLPLYALAAEKLLAGQSASPFRAAYWHLAGKGYQEKNAVKFHIAGSAGLETSDDWRALADALRPRLRSLISGIRQGQFPMHSSDDDCTGFCNFSTVCRVNQARSVEKKWQPPGETA